MKVKPPFFQAVHYFALFSFILFKDKNNAILSCIYLPSYIRLMEMLTRRTKVRIQWGIFLRSRYENATPNLCWVSCALLGVLCNQ